jgi:hypothetical protein
MDSSPQTITESNNSPRQSVSMEKALPTAPLKDFRGPFQYLEVSAIAPDASNSKPNPLTFGIGYQVHSLAVPRTLTQRLEFLGADRNGNKSSELSFIIQSAAGTTFRGPSDLHMLTAEIRIVIYDMVFKGSRHERGPPALVIAMRGDPHLYNEVIERYYHGCTFTLSQYNLRWFEDQFPARFMSIIRNLIVEAG